MNDSNQNWLQRANTTVLRFIIVPFAIAEAVLIQGMNHKPRFTVGYVIALVLIKCVTYPLFLGLIAAIIALIRRRGFWSALSWLTLAAALFDVAVQVLGQILLDL